MITKPTIPPLPDPASLSGNDRTTAKKYNAVLTVLIGWLDAITAALNAGTAPPPPPPTPPPEPPPVPPAPTPVPPPPTTGTVASISVTLPKMTLTVGETVTAVAVAKDANGVVLTGKTFIWNSSSHVTVTQAGVVKAVAQSSPGTAEITAEIGAVYGEVRPTVVASGTVPVPAPVPVPPPAPTPVPTPTPAPTPMPSPAVILPHPAYLVWVTVPPALPTTEYRPTIPPFTRQVRVNTIPALQQAIDTAQPGDDILTPVAQVLTGVAKLRGDHGGGWARIRTDTPILPEGTRARPSQSGGLTMLNGPGSNESPIQTEGPTSKWVLDGLRVSSPTAVTALVRLGTSYETSLAQLPKDLVLRHIVAMTPAGVDVARTVMLGSGATMISDSWLETKSKQSTDAQAIGGWSGPGPYTIENDTLRSNGINFLLGGADPLIAGLISSDVVLRKCDLSKDAAWLSQGYNSKNLLETKNVRRMLVEGCWFNGNWQGFHNGVALSFKSVNQEGNAPWCLTSDVTVRWSRFENIASIVNLQGFDSLQPVTGRTARVAMYDNVGDRINRAPYSSGTSYILLAMAGIRDVAIDFNTWVEEGIVTAADQATYLGIMDVPPAVVGFSHRGNIEYEGYWGLKAQPGTGTVTLDAYAKPYWWDGNVMATRNGIDRYPARTKYITSYAQAGFVDLPGRNYALSASSPLKGFGPGGRDPGADVAKVQAMTAGAVVAP